jgi:hypothetical protein
MISLMAGDCIWIETNKDRDGYIQRHCFVLLFDGATYTGNTIIVPIDTLRSERQDKTVILEPGDLDFITSRSFIHYNLARTTSIKSLIEKIENRVANKNQQSVSNELLEKIKEGVRKSKGTRHEILTEYSYRMFG